MICFPYAIVPGDTFGAKRSALARMTIDDMDGLLNQGGSLFHGKSTVDILYLIPSGQMIVEVSTENFRLLRWGVSGDDQEQARVQTMAEAMCSSCPEYLNASQPRGAFLQFMRDHLGR